MQTQGQGVASDLRHPGGRMASSCRMAIYSQDSLGLGHLRRTSLIGGAFLEAAKDSNVLLLADSPVAPFFQLPNSMDHIKLPSIRKVSAGGWEATRLRMDRRSLWPNTRMAPRTTTPYGPSGSATRTARGTSKHSSPACRTAPS